MIENTIVSTAAINVAPHEVFDPKAPSSGLLDCRNSGAVLVSTFDEDAQAHIQKGEPFICRCGEVISPEDYRPIAVYMSLPKRRQVIL